MLKPNTRCRLRDLGVVYGSYKPGPFNAITDVPHVRVGHSTIIKETPRGSVRTGVTAVLPFDDDVYMNRVLGSGFVLNGAGELSGMMQVLEWGLLETPILLTNSLSVGVASES